MVLCVTSSVGRRKLFWATQPDACDVEESCGGRCGSPGLTLTGNDPDGQRSISTENWLRGLLVNMLMTDGRRPDTPCGYTPIGQGGHWSESYIEDNAGIGTLIRTVSPAKRTSELEAVLSAYAQQTLSKLIGRGVARSVEVKVTYVSGGTFNVEAAVVGVDNLSSRIGLSAQRLENGWVWG